MSEDEEGGSYSDNVFHLQPLFRSWFQQRTFSFPGSSTNSDCEILRGSQVPGVLGPSPRNSTLVAPLPDAQPPQPTLFHFFSELLTDDWASHLYGENPFQLLPCPLVRRSTCWSIALLSRNSNTIPQILRPTSLVNPEILEFLYLGWGFFSRQ